MCLFFDDTCVLYSLNKQNVVPSNRLVCQAGVYFSAPLVWTMSTLNFLHRMCCLMTRHYKAVCSLHFPSFSFLLFLSLWGYWTMSVARTRETACGFFPFFFLSSTAEKAISCTLESHRLVFNSDFVLFHLQNNIFFLLSLLCKFEIG